MQEPAWIQQLPHLSNQLGLLRWRIAEFLQPNLYRVFSDNGESFRYESTTGPQFPAGSYVTIKVNANRQYLGQITDVGREILHGPEFGIKLMLDRNTLALCSTNEADFVDRAEYTCYVGNGVILGEKLTLDEHGKETGKFAPVNRGIPFSHASISQAKAEMIREYLSAAVEEEARLEIGSVLDIEGEVPVFLNAKEFNRHTFLCGQSGSGKSFSLGVILEKLLEKTELRIAVLDPNSDFTGLNKVVADKEDLRRFLGRRDKVEEEEYKKIQAQYDNEVARGVRIVRLVGGDLPLVLRMSDLDRSEQGAVLGLHPLHDRDEFGTLRRILDMQEQKPDGKLYSWDVLLDNILRDPLPMARDIRLRIENLGITVWPIWCKTLEPSLIDLWFRRQAPYPAPSTEGKAPQEDWRCMVIDIGDLNAPEQKQLVTAAILGQFWRQRNTIKESKEPVLIVIDEAHNVCPQQPTSPLEEIITDYVIRIAGEGRKYGLFLLIASQRPAKIHPNVVSQCGNLVLMKMTSSVDQEYLAGVFSQVPPSLLSRSQYFGKGQALLAGSFVPSATFARFTGRRSAEGGGDVKVLLASGNPSKADPQSVSEQPVASPVSSVEPGKSSKSSGLRSSPRHDRHRAGVPYGDHKKT
jgi:DNA helicase HerA-like ATPase